MRLLFPCFLVYGFLFATANAQASVLTASCLTQLDDAVSLFDTGNTNAAATQLDQLAISCSELPQVHHNLGVIAAVRHEWQAASEHFKRALAFDARTNNTQSHLQAIHQFKSSLAYKKALGIDSSPTMPELSMQNSAAANAVVEAPIKTSLHNVSTLDYELFSWWTAAATNAMPSWLEHYAVGYPPVENTDAQVVHWDDVGRDISFTAQDAVVVLSYQKNDIEKRMLLLLRLQNNRWKIYRETTL